MKADIYYFTGTGNSLTVAKDLAKEIEGKLISIAYVMGKGLIKTKAMVIVIVYPVYMWGIPHIIEKFIQSFEDLDHKYVCAIATHGGTPGVTLDVLEKVIEECKGKLAGGFTVNMPGNYVPKYGAFAEEKQNELFDESSKKVKFIAQYIKDGKQGEKERSNMLPNYLLNFIYHHSTKLSLNMDKNFWTDEKCNQCGICQKVCPVGNIDMNSGSPYWNGQCEQCFACLHWCPQEAIQYGKKTIMRKRYHHPDVDISEILIPLNIMFPV